ncbi:major facilitator superfamily domain-containing protein 1 isoform X2 [Fukomys damarensis]|uniref:major facilitator superfamily domain-containing protein 1 isoform X2 n=1 Tax=Fukomys damarensis TaxID=885580 RepID=UPI0014553B15|nr:major facilitator superfamily domain-containing protein 1 isoform X2 [Fukomys damarensis]
MEEEEEEARALLAGGPDEARSGIPAASRALSALCDPSHLAHRLLVLLLMCFLGFGSYFCYDNPAALQTQIQRDMQVNTTKFMLLYAWYSWPNVVLCFLGGFLIDRVFGIRWGTIIFICFVCIGQVIFALGGIFNAFWLMELGRFVFGIGGESLAVAQNTYAVSWFKGKELNLVFGLQLSMARILFSRPVSGDLISLPLFMYQSESLPSSACVWAALLPASHPQAPFQLSSSEFYSEFAFSGSTVNMNLMGWLYSKIEASLGSAGPTTLGATLLIGGITCILSLICALALAYLDQRAEKILHKEQGKTGEVIKLTDIKDFPLPLWLIFIICVGYYVVVFPFIGLGNVVYVISAPMSPIFGLLVDKTGKNIIWVLCAVTTTLVSHMMLAFTMWNPWIAMCLLGLSYSLLACALWPMVAFLVPEHQLGTAYGFMQSIQNLGLAVISIIAGMILDTRGYLFLDVFFIACVSVALLSVVLLYLVNRARGGNLNYSTRQREEMKLSHTE